MSILILTGTKKEVEKEVVGDKKIKCNVNLFSRVDNTGELPANMSI